MEEAERERVAGEVLARVVELIDRAGPPENGRPLPPDIAAEVHAVLAKGRAMLGPLSPEDAAEVELILAELRMTKAPPCPHGEVGCSYGSGSCDCCT